VVNCYTEIRRDIFELLCFERDSQRRYTFILEIEFDLELEYKSQISLRFFA